jgi:hypothetical protein
LQDSSDLLIGMAIPLNLKCGERLEQSIRLRGHAMLKRKLQEASDRSETGEYAPGTLDIERCDTSQRIATAEQRAAKAAAGLRHPKTGLYAIALSGALGALAPLFALALLGFQMLRPGVGRASTVLLVLVWPTSILLIDAPNPYRPAEPIFLRSYIGNIAIYLLFGCVVWLGLMRPCSVIYLTIVAVIYIGIVSFAEFCAWLVV